MKKLTTKDLTLIGLMSAVMCILGPLSLPIGPVPISLTNLAIYFAVYLLGTKRGTISFLIYLLLGLIGLPIFSGFQGGPQKLFGVTGGYLFGFILMAIIGGLFIEKFPEKRILHFIGIFLGTVLCYVLGTLWFVHLMGDTTFVAALGICVIPFIPGDIAKMLLAVAVAPQLQHRIKLATQN